MNRLFKHLMVVILMGQLTFAQEQVLILSESMFESHQQIPLATNDGWVFKEGNNPEWSQINVSTNGWKPLKVSEINSEYEDESGRIEGWFRIKLKIDSSLANLELGLDRRLWAATDVYLNGELLHSFGNTGNPYQAYNPLLKYPIPIKFNSGQEYVLAVHFVDYETTFTQREIRLKPENLNYFLNLTGPSYNVFVAENEKQTYIYATLCIGISFLLFFLFWLLVFINPKQNIFKLIAIMATLVLITAIAIFFNTFYEISYTTEKVRYIVMISLQLFSILFGLMVLEWVLLNKITKVSISLLIVLGITNIVAHLFSISFPFGITFSGMIIYFCFLLYTYRKLIKGGTLAVVAAIVVPLIANFVFINLHRFSLDFFYKYDKLIITITVLSAPLFLLVYIAMRFKEVLKDVEEEADKVLQITQEKKDLLEDQNVRLETLVKERTSELKNSLENLKATQSQLIQSEKMASLGELTAGIAHEIQNPLNFVNNFSEVSNELIDEMNEELDNGDLKEVKLIATDIKQNLEKINHHGKRADGIVKGMLQHSRSSTGIKELTDINKLADEYLRLAYHGLRAKDQSFNATLETDYDKDIGQLEVIPQDLGRVILNLITNAFYACNEKKNALEAEGYNPTVSISTEKLKDRIIISVKDNGNGIPKHIINKIFQPFFTTKPTGEGTGLGLSMSYDILTKGHGGELKVRTIRGKGTTFTITLPTKKI